MKNEGGAVRKGWAETLMEEMEKMRKKEEETGKKSDGTIIMTPLKGGGYRVEIVDK